MNSKVKLTYIITSLCLVALIGFYVYQVMSVTRETYLMENYQERIAEYSRENKSLEYEFLQNNSFFEVENIARELDFKEVDQVSYVEVLGSEVVVR